MSSLFCSKDFGIDCSVHFNLEALPSLWYGVKGGAIPGAPCWTYAAAAVFFGSRPLASHIHSPAGACCGERLPRPSGPWCLIYLHRFQAAWPSSETDINGKDQSGLAFEEVWRTLLCKPAEGCGVPFMFPFCLCPEGKGRIFTWWGLLMLVANSFQINFYIFFLFPGL